MKKFLFFFLWAGILCAQDLTGHWILVGNMDNGYYAELNLVQNKKNEYAGHSYDTENGGFCRHWLEATFNPNTKKLVGKDVELIDKSPEHEATDYSLMYYKENGKEFLMGTQSINPLQSYGMEALSFEWLLERGSKSSMVVYMKVSKEYKPHSPGMPNTMTKEEIELEKAEHPELKDYRGIKPAPPKIKNPTPQQEVEEEEEEKNNDSSPQEIKKHSIDEAQVVDTTQHKTIIEKKESRNNELLAYITLQNVEEITLLIKDYGEEDNDTVTVFFNNELSANNIRLNHEAQEFKFKLKPKQINELVFVANNLGDVPPNTARITIIANNRRYNYKLFTDEKNNALIRLENQ